MRWYDAREAIQSASDIGLDRRFSWWVSFGSASMKQPAFAEPDKVIRAEKYVLVDKSGTRGSWTADENGSASLTMKSARGDIVLKVGDQANSLRISAPSGKVSLEVREEKVSFLLMDSRSRKRGEIGLEGLTIRSKPSGNAGQILWSAP